uniref:Dysbindin domain-containing protein 1 n=1 Tax=Amphiprion ocellaris TaxID=80972 RepID=A0AAQ5XFQ1_AMPOC
KQHRIITAFNPSCKPIVFFTKSRPQTTSDVLHSDLTFQWQAGIHCSEHTSICPCAVSRHLSHCNEPLSSVSSLEVHFDLLDLTELTDMSDQELAEVFADSDEENHNESPAGSHQPVLPRGGYMRSPSWTRCSKAEPLRERKHHSDSDTAEPLMKLERPKQP